LDLDNFVRFGDLPQMWHFFGFEKPIFFVICELEASTCPQIHTVSPYTYSVQCPNSNF
jgi:hypothetical protein